MPLDSAPEVSVVMGVFNGAADLPATLESVLRQEGCAIEFIVVDDGSTDGGADVLDRAAAADTRLRVVHQANQGLTRALATGCTLARGRYIARQDAGDRSLPGRLRRQRDLLASDASLGFVSCATRYVEAAGATLYENRGSGPARERAIDMIDLSCPFGVADGPSHHGSVMVRREDYVAVGGYRAQFHFGQDWDLWYRLAQRGRFAIIDDVLYEATVGPGDISSTRRPLQQRLAQLSLDALKCRLAGQTDEAVLRAAERILPLTKASALAARRTRAAGNYFIGECLRRNGETPRAARYFAQALHAAPWHARAWVRLAQSWLRAHG